MIDHFYSDPHFSHKRIIEYANRPFRDVHEMNTELVRRYNAVVSDDDLVLWCGDCSWNIQTLKVIMELMAGRKALVIGNHDKNARKMARLPFEFVTDTLNIHTAGYDLLVCHYPPKKARFTGREYDDRYADKRPDLHGNKDLIVVHGHTHEKNRCIPGQQRIHVGVDAWAYAPVSMDEAIELCPAALGRV